MSRYDGRDAAAFLAQSSASFHPALQTVHIHGGYWQRGSKEIFACLSEGPLARGWSAALCGYTLAPEASLTQFTNELKSAFDWLDATAGEHGIQGPSLSPVGPQAGI